jgi:dienelactone hydrolase
MAWTELTATGKHVLDAYCLQHEAGHGFNCDDRAAFDPASARLAGERTHQFLEEHLQC